MIYFILKGHSFIYETQTSIQIFYPNERYIISEGINESGITVWSEISGNTCTSRLYIDGKKKAEQEVPLRSSELKELKMAVKLCLFLVLRAYTGFFTPWGALTGIRPTKRIFEMWGTGYSDAEILRRFDEFFFVSKEKSELCLEVAKRERAILEYNNEKKVSLYIGVPFCPTKCLYCSFTSYELGRYKHFVGLYLDTLFKELEFLSGHLDTFEIESIYVGGGTPTSLDEKELDVFLRNITKYFTPTKEFTVEAGRPDTLNEGKLKLLKDYGVNRISVNPQTLNEKTLRLIGRAHTVSEFFEAFEAARKTGHENINVDLIIGLPGEDTGDVLNTMQRIKDISPESLTVHTLAVKRASELKKGLDSFRLPEAEEMEKMLAVTGRYAKRLDLKPYYLYRQKNMVGSFENVGYAREGCEGLYNVQIMEERQTVFAAGAGGVSKIYYQRENRLERIFNVKSVKDYIERIDEMIERKKGELKWN